MEQDLASAAGPIAALAPRKGVEEASSSASARRSVEGGERGGSGGDLEVHWRRCIVGIGVDVL
jgi:hypothetical protein